MALYGCGTGADGAPYRSVGEFGTVPAVELGLGYAAGPARFELLVEYRLGFAFKGRANFLAPGSREEVRARLSSVSGMLSAYVDLDAVGSGPVFRPRRSKPRIRRCMTDRTDVPVKMDGRTMDGRTIAHGETCAFYRMRAPFCGAYAAWRAGGCTTGSGPA